MRLIIKLHRLALVYILAAKCYKLIFFCGCFLFLSFLK